MRTKRSLMPVGPSVIPMVPGPWQSLDDDEARAFLQRLDSVLARLHGPVAFTRHLPISNPRVMPLSFYPGWVLVEAEAQVTSEEIGTFDVLYGPGFMWVIDGEPDVIYDLNAGRVPTGTTAAAPSFLPSPLAALDATVTGPDYLRFYCGSVWSGDDGPFWLVENPDAPLLQGASYPDEKWREHVKPVTMTKVGDCLIAEAIVCTMGSLFSARFKVQGDMIIMEDDEPLTGELIPKQRYETPFRNLRPSTTKVAETKGER